MEGCNEVVLVYAVWARKRYCSKVCERSGLGGIIVCVIDLFSEKGRMMG